MIFRLMASMLMIFSAKIAMAAPINLAKCSSPEDKTNASLSFDSESKKYFLKASVLHRSPGKSKRKLLKFDQATTGFDKVTAEDDAGSKQQSEKQCSIVYVPLLDPENSKWKLCLEGMGELEWMGKYTAGKSGAKNPENEKKFSKYKKLIADNCKEFDGKVYGVAIFANKNGKSCDRVGIFLEEFSMPVGMMRASPRIEGVFPDDTSNCSFDSASIEKIKSKTL